MSYLLSDLDLNKGMKDDIEYIDNNSKDRL